MATLDDEPVEPPVRLIRSRYAEPRAATEFRFLVRSADGPEMLSALQQILRISYVDNPEYFQLAAAVEQRARELATAAERERAAG